MYFYWLSHHILASNTGPALGLSIPATIVSSHVQLLSIATDVRQPFFEYTNIPPDPDVYLGPLRERLP